MGGDELLVRGFWGPRAEDDGELAGRLGAFLDRLGDRCPGGLEGWVLPEGDRLEVDDPAWLAEYVHRRAEQGRREDPGLGIVEALGAASPSGAKFGVTISAGMTTQAPALHNSVVVEMKPPDGGDEGEWLSRAVRALAALAEAWDPDWGDAATRQLRKAVRGQIGRFRQQRRPETGCAVYLSAARWAAARAALVSARREEVAGGGIVSLIGDDGASPAVERVIALDQALDAAGALGMMPADAPRFGDAPVPEPDHGAAAGMGTEPVMKLNLKYRPAAVNAPRFADGIVAAAREISGAELDYSPASLRQVDQIIGEMRRDGAPAEAVGETLFGFGAYVGEMLVRHAGARWVDLDEARSGDFGQALGVEMPGGMLWNPIGKAFKRFGGGDAESLESFYQQATAR